MFSNLYICSVGPVPRGTSPRRRGSARRRSLLFAERGPDRVTVRDVAAAAEVSPGLVMHHFGSKAGLREAVDEHVAHTFDAMLDTLTDDGTA